MNSRLSRTSDIDSHGGLRPRRRPRPQRGIAVVLALIAVSAAVVLAVTLSSTGNQSALTSESLVRTAKARTASAGGIDIACALVDRHGLAGFEIPGDGSVGDPNELFRRVTIGSAQYAGFVHDLDGGGPVDSSTLAVRLRVEATADELTQFATAVGRLVQPDAVVRADLDLSEFGILSTGGAGSIAIGADAIVGVWAASPLAALHEPVLLGSSALNPDAVALGGENARGYAVITTGAFPTSDDEYKDLLAEKRYRIPLGAIPVPAAPRPGRSEYALVARIDTLPTEGDDPATWHAYLDSVQRHFDPSGHPTLSVEVDEHRGNINFDEAEVCLCSDSVAYPYLKLKPLHQSNADEYPTIESGEWRQIDFAGDLVLRGCGLHVEAPSLLIVRGDLTLEDGAFITPHYGVPLTIVVFGEVSVVNSVIGNVDFVKDGSFYPDAGASNIVIYGTRDIGPDHPRSFDFTDGSSVAAQIYAPTRDVVFGKAALYGSLVGATTEFSGVGARFHYDPALNQARGFSSPVSAMWDDGDARPQLLEVEELTDRAIARALASLESEALALSIDSIGSGIFVPLHAGFAGGNVARFSAEIAEVESLIETPPSRVDRRTIGAIVRDFRPSDDIDGNPGFARKGGAHSGTWVNLVKPDLGAGQRPEFNDDPGAARKVKDLRFETSGGEEIHASLFNGALGDRSFPIGGGGNSGEPIPNPGNFATWFEDDGVSNSSRPVLLELERVMVGPTESFVFELSETDHPVKGRLFGEVSDLSEAAPGEDKTKKKKRAFTMETALDFVRDTSADQRFGVTSSGDLWVFLNGRLVAEIGAGGKSRFETTQVVPIERLGIADGMPCEIRIFFAHREESPNEHARLRFASNFEVSTPLAFVRDTPYTAPDADAQAIRNARQSTRNLHNGGGLGTPQYAERRLANWMRRFE